MQSLSSKPQTHQRSTKKTPKTQSLNPLLHPLIEMPNKDNANTLRNAELSKSFPKTNHIPIPQTITNPRNPNLFLPFLLLHHPSNPPVPKPLGNPLPPPLPPANSLIANANGSGKMLRLDATKQRDFSTHFVGLRYPILLFLFLAHVMRFGIWVWLRFENERAEVWLRVRILEGKGEKEGLMGEKVL